MKAKKGDLVILTKITDDRFNGDHPNGINEGYQRIGYLKTDVEVGSGVLVENPTRYLHTSTVTEIVNNYTFKTKNSTYIILVYEDN